MPHMSNLPWMEMYMIIQLSFFLSYLNCSNIMLMTPMFKNKHMITKNSPNKWMW